MTSGTFMFFGERMVPSPSTLSVQQRGWGIVEDAYAHAVWSEDWRSLTGKSWDQWKTDAAAERERWGPDRAKFDVTLDPKTARVSRALVTSAGLLALVGFDTHSAVDDEPPMVTMRMYMHDVTIRTR